ncbi:uncharacterized protein [Amphiura filiformis]|uniref:uncharacterized protein n=1 Tax=Amphiura filiformis TaxID=82378 RepID=UPI003B20D7F1
MADLIQNGISSHHVHDDAILLKFQRYRERLRVLGAEGKLDELVAHYDTYAKSFGKFFEITGYVGGMTMAEAVTKAQPNKDANILDCGCGDGALGTRLQKMGYTNLSALDPSQAMIDECSKRTSIST